MELLKTSIVRLNEIEIDQDEFDVYCGKIS